MMRTPHRSPVEGLNLFKVRRFCRACGAVSLLHRRKLRCPVCHALLELVKDVQGQWGNPSFRREITGDPPMVVEQPWLPGLGPGGGDDDADAGGSGDRRE